MAELVCPWHMDGKGLALLQSLDYTIITYIYVYACVVYLKSFESQTVSFGCVNDRCLCS